MKNLNYNWGHPIQGFYTEILLWDTLWAFVFFFVMRLHPDVPTVTL